MKFFKHAVLFAVILCPCAAWGVSPRIGYAYPAGGEQGTKFEVLLGGQFLNGVSGVRISGEGVQGTIIQYGKPFNNKQLMELRRQVMVLLRARRAGDTGKTLATLLANSEAFVLSKVSPLPEHPLLRNLDNMSLKELEYWVALYGDVKKRQVNPQLAEMVLIEVAVDPGAAPGWRELRLVTPAGLTNPLNFHVGNLFEIKENEPNDQASSLDPADPPVVFNGQILPGDRDRFTIRAKRGQRLVMQVDARRLVPYLADAVPGWFQSVLAVSDAAGREVAFADDYRFDPDPALLYKIPEDGEYTVEVHDSLYRGREDFVYRITVGALPFVTQFYPLGGRAGERTTASVSGWNLAKNRIELNTEPGGTAIRNTVLEENGLISNNLSYAVNTLPECSQKEPNDTTAKAQKLDLPVIVNGVIERPDDVDVYRFKGHAGERVVAEVCARRLGSPLDSLLRLTDASGKVLEWNDDYEDRETGLTTHQADSCLCAELKEDAEYFVQISDAQHNGGAACGYRLRVGQPQPDFALRVTPSCINVGAGRDAVVSVCALRRDGFDGPIDLALKDMPPGFTLSGAQIPVGCESIRMTLRAPKKGPNAPLPLHIEGSGEIQGKKECREAAPAEDMMQAFLYRHLVPAQEMLVAVARPRQPAPPVSLTPEGPVRIPLGGTAQVWVNTPPRPMLQNVKLVLSDPPKGISIQEVTVVPEGLQFALNAESGEAGYKDNLIVQAFLEVETQQGGKPAKQKQRNELGPLPAVPIEIVQP